jgi:phosphonopyruvate decarboxylase
MFVVKEFVHTLEQSGINFFSGVPDSLLKDFCDYLQRYIPSERHVIAANEGGAVALGIGYHLATGRVPLVYLQNSGLGNLVNPLMSLASGDVYGIPILLLIGWRGEPGVPDEPQHKAQGRMMLSMLSAMEIPYVVIGADTDSKNELKLFMRQVTDESRPGAVVVRKGTFMSEPIRVERTSELPLSREDAVNLISDLLEPHDIVVSTTGMASRELYECREKRNQPHDRDFLTVGGMGHASQIALGIALQRQQGSVYCFDGDGAVLMHMGALAINGSSGCKTLKHIVLNNGAHDSVGGQPTVGFETDLLAIARACGYRNVLRAVDKEGVINGLKELQAAAGPALLEVRIRKGNRSDLSRPTRSPQENKQALMGFIQSCSKRI